MRPARGIRSTLGTALLILAALAGTPARAQVTCVPDAKPGGEWPMFGGNLSGSHSQPLESTLTPANVPLLAPAWTFSANDAVQAINPNFIGRNEITGYPIEIDGCVFVATSTGFQEPGWVFALNAYGGDVVWSHFLPFGVYSSLAVANGLVYAYVSQVGSPYVVALSEADGHEVWTHTVDNQPGSDAVASPIVFDSDGPGPLAPMVWAGVSGTLAEGDAYDRLQFRGASVLLDASTGALVKHQWSIPDDQFATGDAGAAVWSTISIDGPNKVGYVGTGNPFNYQHKSDRTNAVLKIDLDRSHAAVGRVLAYYRGDTEQYLDAASDFNGTCDATSGSPLIFSFGFDCEHLDLDFGSQPNIFTDRGGRRLIGAGQKSGVYHVFDPDPAHYIGPADSEGAREMPNVWSTVMGVPSPVGGIVGSAAYDGTALYVPHSLVGYMTALDRDAGAIKWATPIGDGVHWGPPATVANGIVYTPDLKGFLDAYDAGTGAPLLHRPMELGANSGADPTFTWGGVTVARNTVYATVGVGLTSIGSGDGQPYPSMPNGFVIAFRPMKVGL
ncbi:MAG: PQQ-binding-like beta-propeller repeat protein [Actinomycetota bacterium]|nr:PQQ-binding-like beta-propeller repeat protein [Actinomycetota bacterium]